MMKLIHGKYKKLFLILFLTITSFANVKVSVNSPVIYEGEVVNFIISADGQSPRFPNINEIAGYPIIGTSSSQSISMVNTKVTRTTSKTYSFKASKSLTIPSFVVLSNGRESNTNPITVKVIKPKTSQKGDDFVLEISLDKNESYVGEALDLSISFKSKVNAQADQVQLGEPKLEDFWVKKTKEIKRSRQGKYTVQTLHYRLFPQKSGHYNIPAIEALIGKLERRKNNGRGFFDDPFFNSMVEQLNWKKIYSNSLKLEVKPLPNGLELYGDYSIKSSVDTQKVKLNKPVNLSISIEGKGNIDDVKKFELAVDNVIIYSDEPQTFSEDFQGVYQGTFDQKIALISDQNFTIPSLSLTYFDKKTKKVKTVKTQAIKIEVIGGYTTPPPPSQIEMKENTTLHIKKTTPTSPRVLIEKEDAYLKYLFLLLGFILGIIMMFLLNMYKKREKKKELNKVRLIKNAKSDQILFEFLLPYAKEHTLINKALTQLEENLYREASHHIDKESLMEVFEELEERR